VLAVAIAALVAVGVIAGTRMGASPAQNVTVRVIDDGAPGGPAVLSTQIVPLH
jgi:hypothetical protein